MVNEIVAAIVGGFVGWVAIQGISYFVVRSRLITYIVVHANVRLLSMYNNCEWLQQLVHEHSKVGVIATNAPRYSPDHAEDLHEARELVLRYLFRAEIERITKYLSYLWEAEYLTEGVCAVIGDYAKRATPLYDDDCLHLKNKVARVTSIVSRWPLSIKSLNDLPIDYAGV